MSEFYNLAKKVHVERVKEQNKKINNFKYRAEKLFVNFKMWCLAFGKDEINYKDFNLFIKETKQKKDFWINKYIFEKYFNFEFKFNHNLNKWEVVE